MRGKSWSDAEKQRAMTLVAEHGLAHAWRETGIPKPTIVRWCQDAGIERFHPEQTRAAVDALQARSSTLRELLRLSLLERADDLLERMDEPHIEFKGKDADQVEYPIAPASAVQNYATSAAILIDKHLLMSGEATGRTESTLLRGKSDHEQQLLADVLNRELERRAYVDAAGDQADDPVAQPATAEPGPA
jgi:transposase-like protein